MTNMWKKIGLVGGQIAAAFLIFAVLPFAAQAQSVLKEHDTYQAIDISADQMELYEKLGRTHLKGSVKVIQGKMTLSADNLLVFYQREKGQKDPSIQRLDASGAFVLASSSETVTGDWGIYDVAARLVTVGGNVTLQQGDNVLKGERLELDLVSGRAKLDGKEDPATGQKQRVKGRFSVPDKK